jgi:hypothetical protein
MRQTTSKRLEVPRAAAHGGSDFLVLELETLLARVHAVTQTIDAAIACELAAGRDEAPADIVVLDDLTPRYLKADSALKACNAHLGGALQFLRSV